jgi:hypothetical protein
MGAVPGWLRRGAAFSLKTFGWNSPAAARLFMF